MHVDRSRAQVFFCVDCVDQAPWRAGEMGKCPACLKTCGVMAAQRYQNLTSEVEGNHEEG